MPSLSRKCKYQILIPTSINIYRFVNQHRYEKLVRNLKLVCINGGDDSVENFKRKRKETCSAIDIIGPPNDSYRRIYTSSYSRLDSWRAVELLGPCQYIRLWYNLCSEITPNVFGFSSFSSISPRKIFFLSLSKS